MIYSVYTAALYNSQHMPCSVKRPFPSSHTNKSLTRACIDFKERHVTSVVESTNRLFETSPSALPTVSRPSGVQWTCPPQRPASAAGRHVLPHRLRYSRSRSHPPPRTLRLSQFKAALRNGGTEFVREERRERPRGE